MKRYAPFSLQEIFHDIKKGTIHASNQLDSGDAPLIGCGFLNMGVEGFFSFDASETNENAVTIAGDGSYPLTAFYHDYVFAAKDNVVVCIPKDNMSLAVRQYLAVTITKSNWRFSYGRKCYHGKLLEQRFLLPVNGHGEFDKEFVESRIKVKAKDRFPPKTVRRPLNGSPLFKEFVFGSELKGARAGIYHALSELDEGSVPLASCGEFRNGVIGNYDISFDQTSLNTLTIAYNGIPLTTRFHPYRFGAKDDVAVFTNKMKLRTTTLIFIGALLNRQTWRFSYGRKCFSKKLNKQRILLPVDQRGILDEDFMEEVVVNSPYWKYLSERVTSIS